MAYTNVYKDIEKAIEIISNKESIYKVVKNLYSNSSAIYRFSNECIDSYKKWLINRQRILSITSSGDQMLSSILFGTKEIDSVDISTFPKYYFELKKAAIKVLDLEEYIRFLVPEIDVDQENMNIGNRYINTLYRTIALKVFFNNIVTNDKSRREISEMYSAVNLELTGDNKIFWDEIFRKYNPVDIYYSSLFRQENTEALSYIISKSFYNVPYLKDKESYNELKSKIDNCKITHYVGNIYDIVNKLKKAYNLVNLSNIIDYSDPKEYKELMDRFNVSENGIILSYLFTLDNGVDKEFSDRKKYKMKRLSSINENIMIYKKAA